MGVAVGVMVGVAVGVTVGVTVAVGVAVGVGVGVVPFTVTQAENSDVSSSVVGLHLPELPALTIA